MTGNNGICSGIVSDLTKKDKLTEHNYDTWSQKFQYVLDDQDLLEPLSVNMSQPEVQPEGPSDQYRLDLEAYNAWKKKSRAARILLLSSMRNDLMLRFERGKTTKDVWDTVMWTFGGTTVTRRRQLQMRLDSYKKKPNHTMSEHITAISNLVQELNSVSQVISDEQPVQALIRSLPTGQNWSSLKQSLTLDENIKTFDDVARHLTLEEDMIMSENPPNEAEAHMTSYDNLGHKNKKHKRGNGKKPGYWKNNKKNKGQYKGKSGSDQNNNNKGTHKKNKPKGVCYNCHEPGHFARECPKEQTQQQQNT